MNLTGSFASEETAIATPPREDPSSFVRITPVNSAVFANAKACFKPRKGQQCQGLGRVEATRGGHSNTAHF